LLVEQQRHETFHEWSHDVPRVIPLSGQQPLNCATVGDITAQQVIPCVLDIPEMDVKMLTKDRDYEMLAM
jgi:hypothetical protein